MLHYCTNLKAIRYESTILDRIVADKSHRVIVVLLVGSVTIANGLIEWIQSTNFNKIQDGALL